MEPAPADLSAIVRRLGGDLYDGGRRALVPGPGHSGGDRSLSLGIGDHGGVIFHSFSGDSVAAIRAHLGLGAYSALSDRLSPSEIKRMSEARRRQAVALRARNVAFCRDVWKQVVPARGTLVETYLHARSIRLEIPSRIGFHPEAPLSYQRRETCPAMVALVTGPGGAATGLHVTYLRPNGLGKADLPQPRKVFGNDISESRLEMGPLPTDGILAVSEGIESGLSFTQLTGRLAWSCLSSLGLGRFVIPDGVRVLQVAADNDPVGRKAALGLLDRASRRCRCEVFMPDIEGEDWNDVLSGRLSEVTL